MFPLITAKNSAELSFLSVSKHDNSEIPEWKYLEFEGSVGKISVQFYENPNIQVFSMEITLTSDEDLAIIPEFAKRGIVYISGNSCLLTVNAQHAKFIHDRGHTGIEGKINNLAFRFLPEISYLVITILFLTPFEIEKLNTASQSDNISNASSTRFLYVKPYISTRETLESISCLLFSKADSEMQVFLIEEISRSLYLDLMASHKTKKYQPGNLRPIDVQDFYRQCHLLIERSAKALPYLKLIQDAGINNIYRFRKLIKQLYGINIRDFITEARMNRASILLRNDTLSIKEIAFQSGFGNIPYFNRIFLAYFKVNPTDFRKLLL